MLHDAIAELSGRLLGVSPENAYGGIADALGTLGRILPAERTSLYLVSGEHDRFDRVQQWRSNAQVGNRGALEDCNGHIEEPCTASWTSSELPWLAEQLSKQRSLRVDCLSELPPEAHAERCLWTARGVGSAIFVPMASGGVVQGVLEIEALGRRREWPEESLALLRITVDAMASLLARARADESLRTSLERLRQSEKLGVMGRMAGGIAHDFNNFLTAIIGYSAVLSDGLDDESPCQEDIAEIRLAAHRASALVDRILNLGKSQPGEAQDFDPSAGVAEMRKILRRIAGDGIELQVDLADSPYRIRLDPSSFDQLLVNLTANARDAMPQGGILKIATDVVEVSSGGVCRGAPVGAPAELAPGRYALLTVSDTGCGMDEEVAARIFDVFYTTKASGKGTGLGLATIAGIVSEAGGSIALETAPNAGAVFRIFLPVVRARSAALREPSKALRRQDSPRLCSATPLALEPKPPAHTGPSIG